MPSNVDPESPGPTRRRILAALTPTSGYVLGLMMTVFMNASPMLSDVASARSATAMWTIRRSYGLSGPIS